jgi:acetyltransferase-like isoleucine patch superfamily enzyme
MTCTVSREYRDDGQIAVGRSTYYFGEPFVLYAPADRIEVGAFCSLARDVHILGGGEHALDLPSTYPFRTVLSRADEGEWDVFAKGPTRIGNDVWLGFGATVLSGSTIGDGAIVAARAVVGGVEIPPYAIVVGNPGRIVAYRFDEATVARLLALRWWDWPDERIAEMEPYFYAGVEVFLTESEGRFGSANGTPDRSNSHNLRGIPRVAVSTSDGVSTHGRVAAGLR